MCSQAARSGLIEATCFVYDFQTLLTGAVAILVAILAGVPVWRQLRDSNLQTRISHRETLATMLRDGLARYEKVDQSIRVPLSQASDVTSDPLDQPKPINPHDAHHIEQLLSGALDWYLVVLAGTEHADIETHKRALQGALTRLVETLSDAHWAEHNEQDGEDYAFSDERWAEILARCDEAKVEAATRVSEARSAYRNLCEAQGRWVQSLRNRIATLDLEIAAAA